MKFLFWLDARPWWNADLLALAAVAIGAMLWM